MQRSIIMKSLVVIFSVLLGTATSVHASQNKSTYKPHYKQDKASQADFSALCNP